MKITIKLSQKKEYVTCAHGKVTLCFKEKKIVKTTPKTEIQKWQPEKKKHPKEE